MNVLLLKQLNFRFVWRRKIVAVAQEYRFNSIAKSLCFVASDVLTLYSDSLWLELFAVRML